MRVITLGFHFWMGPQAAVRMSLDLRCLLWVTMLITVTFFTCVKVTLTF